jgi:hypothetical protein
MPEETILFESPSSLVKKNCLRRPHHAIDDVRYRLRFSNMLFPGIALLEA